MTESQHASVVPADLSQLAAEFKRLDVLRRRRGLSLDDSDRYRVLLTRFSDALAASERCRGVDERQFLRVPFPMQLVMRRSLRVDYIMCRDFGGGGCAILSDERLPVGQEVWLDSARFEGEWQPLHVRAIVVWRCELGDAEPQRYGLRFALDSADEHDVVDRLFYRVLDLFLRR